MNLASLLVNAIFPKLFHGWVRIRSLKSSNEHTGWKKCDVFGRLPCRAQGEGKGPVSLGQGLILSYRFGYFWHCPWRSTSALPVPAPACSAAGPWALHSSSCSLQWGSPPDVMPCRITHCSTRVGRTHKIQSTKKPSEQSVPWGVFGCFVQDECQG